MPAVASCPVFFSHSFLALFFPRFLLNASFSRCLQHVIPFPCVRPFERAHTPPSPAYARASSPCSAPARLARNLACVLLCRHAPAMSTKELTTQVCSHLALHLRQTSWKGVDFALCFPTAPPLLFWSRPSSSLSAHLARYSPLKELFLPHSRC
eukprot:607316-Pleurochrysis_carterae.AAC.1